MPVTFTTQIEPPSNTSISSSAENEVTVTWTDNSSVEDGYKVYRSTDNTNFSEVASVSANTTSYTDTGLPDGETYYYYVESYNGTDSSSGNVVSIDILGTPTNFSIDSGGDNFSVSWTDNSTNEDGFDIEVSVDGGAYSVDTSVGANTTSATLNAPNGTGTYDIRVTAYTSEYATTSAVDSADVLTRSATVFNGGSIIDSVRSNINKDRTPSAHTQSSSATSVRTAIAKTRVADSYTGSSHIEATRSGKTTDRSIAWYNKPSSADSVSVFQDLFKDGIGKYDVAYRSEYEAFVSEWIHEEPIRDTEDIVVRLSSKVDTGPIRVAVERDDNGDGRVNAMSDWVETQGGQTPARIPDIGKGDAEYRVLIRGADVAFDDFITDIDIGFAHK